jgi:hypothetical protein
MISFLGSYTMTMHRFVHIYIYIIYNILSEGTSTIWRFISLQKNNTASAKKIRSSRTYILNGRFLIAFGMSNVSRSSASIYKLDTLGTIVADVTVDYAPPCPRRRRRRPVKIPTCSTHHLLSGDQVRIERTVLTHACMLYYFESALQILTSHRKRKTKACNQSKRPSKKKSQLYP